jgi:hypothetical protein
MRLDHNQFGNFRHATEHNGSRSGPCEWRWAPSIDKKGKLSRSAGHLASLQAIKAALDPLYASFSDEQKKIADGAN